MGLEGKVDGNDLELSLTNPPARGATMEMKMAQTDAEARMSANYWADMTSAAKAELHAATAKARPSV